MGMAIGPCKIGTEGTTCETLSCMSLVNQLFVVPGKLFFEKQILA
jgi:hypothetical protein